MSAENISADKAAAALKGKQCSKARRSGVTDPSESG